jgi:hypothetical protein
LCHISFIVYGKLASAIATGVQEATDPTRVALRLEVAAGTVQLTEDGDHQLTAVAETKVLWWVAVSATII